MEWIHGKVFPSLSSRLFPRLTLNTLCVFSVCYSSPPNWVEGCVHLAVWWVNLKVEALLWLHSDCVCVCVYTHACVCDVLTLGGRLGIIVLGCCCWKASSPSSANWQEGLLHDRSLMSGWSEQTLSALSLALCARMQAWKSMRISTKREKGRFWRHFASWF